METSSTSILIVDDERYICEFVRFVLADAGYLTRVAQNGPDAIDVVAAGGYPDLLVTDVKMPQMHGDELAARLRHGKPDLKVLFLTGLSRELFARHGALGEGESLLEKPCSAKEILQGVAQLLAGTPVDSHMRGQPSMRVIGRAGAPDV